MSVKEITKFVKKKKTPCEKIFSLRPRNPQLQAISMIIYNINHKMQQENLDVRTIR